MMHGHAPSVAGWQLALAVAGTRHRQLQRLLAALGRFVEQAGAVFDRIAPDRAGDLVDQGFHDKRIVAMAHRAIPQHRHVDLHIVHRQRQVRNRVVRLRHAFGHGAVDAVFHQKRFKRAAGQYRLAGNHVIPGRDLAVRVVTNAHPVHMHRPVVTALDIVLA